MKQSFYSLSLTLFLAAISAHAQTVEGDWQGTLKAGAAELRLVLHVLKDEKGGLKATLDSVDQNLHGLPVTSINFADSNLKFEMQKIESSYEGKVNADRSSISGSWTQRGSSFPLDFTRVIASAPATKKVRKPGDIDGEWEGILNAGARICSSCSTS